MITELKCLWCHPKNPWTETDGSICLKRIFATVAAFVMLYKFITVQSLTPDYQGFAIGFGAIIAALAYVNQAEQKDKKDADHS